MTKTQLVVLGGGPGGYPAAFEAADHGMDVTLVDEGTKPGGVCLHRGCIPSKALLHFAKLINEARDAAGLKGQVVFDDVKRRSRPRIGPGNGLATALQRKVRGHALPFAHRAVGGSDQRL